MKLLQGRLFFALCLLGAFVLMATDAEAARNRRHRQVIFVNRDASILVDADSGSVIQASKANEIRHPASLTKMMTLYLTFEALDKKKIRLTDRMPVSSYAAHQAPTNLDLMQGDTLTVEEAIKALVVRSANDAAVVTAEYIAGSESNFARLMTGKARALGMKQSFFKNASGLPDARQVTSARDLAVLAMALRKHFPQYYRYFNTREFTLNGITYTTHNHVLQRYEWADGLKTGYIRMSGFNLVTSAKKSGHSLIGVVLGGNTIRERDDRMIALLDDGFAQMEDGNIRSVAALVKVPGMKTVRTTPISQDSDDNASISPVSQAEPHQSVAAYDPAYEAGSAEGDVENTEAPRTDWGVQVGMFSAQKEALFAALQAQKLAVSELGKAKVKVVSDANPQPLIHRARLENISQEQAHNACRHLAVQRESCYVYRAGAL